MKLHLPKAWYSVVLAACMTCTAQAGITSSNPYSITLEDGTSTFTAAAEIPGEGDSPATPAVTLRILTCDNANTDVVDGYTGATYTVLASTATSDSTYSQGRFYIDADNEATRINGMGTLIIANGTYRAVENGNAQNFYGGQLKLVGRSVSNDIIIGSETYTENWTGATDAARVNYSGAIQLTHNAKLTGSNLTLVADSQIGVEGDGTKIAYIENAISGAGKSLELLTDHAGNAIHLSGGASLKTLSGAANVVLDDKKSNGSADAGSKSYTMNNITGTGTMTIDSGVTLTLLGDVTANGNTVESTKDISLTGTLQLGDDSNTQRYIKLSGDITMSGNPDIMIRKKADISVTGSVSANKIKFGDSSNTSESILRIKNGGSLTAAQDLDMTNGNANSKAKVVFESGSTGSANKLWMGVYDESERETYIDVANGASLQLANAGVTISGDDSETAARIKRTGGGSGEFGAGRSDFAVSDAKITVDNANGAAVNLTMSGTYSLKNAYSGLVTEQNSNNTNYASVEASTGSITFLNKASGMEVSELTIESKKSVSVYSGDSVSSTAAALTIGKSLEITGNTSINGMLVLKDGVALDLTGSITLSNALTLGSNLSLSDDMITMLGSSNSLTLFTGVTGITGWESEGMVAASDVFSNAEFAENGIYDSHVVSYKGGVVSIHSIPEPTTATLSLLALAGLAARRRRR